MNLNFLARVFFLAFAALYAASSPSFEFHYLNASDDVRIRVGRFCGTGTIAEGNTDKVMLILPGRVSRIERHEFLAQQFAKAGFRVWVLDFRGQGESTRLVANRQMVHVDHFDEYIWDVEALIHWNRFIGQRKFLYSHSMGGQVALQVMRKHPNAFEAAILETPMLRIKTSPIPYFLAEPLAYVMKNWLGQAKKYCLGRGDYDAIKESFEHNRNCRDRELFHRYFHVPEAHKELVSIGPSWGWLHAAFTVTRNLLSNLKLLRQVRTKVFIATAGDDRVLNTNFDATVASSLGGAHCVYPNAWHSIVHDTLDTRERYLTDVQVFLRNHEDFIVAHRPVVTVRNGWLSWLWDLYGRIDVRAYYSKFLNLLY